MSYEIVPQSYENEISDDESENYPDENVDYGYEIVPQPDNNNSVYEDINAQIFDNYLEQFKIGDWRMTPGQGW